MCWRILNNKQTEENMIPQEKYLLATLIARARENLSPKQTSSKYLGNFCIM